MAVIGIFMLMFLALIIGEFVILVWFIRALIRLNKDNTDVSVPWWAPITYLFCTVVLGYAILVMIDFRSMWGGDPLPYATRFGNYVNMLLMTNVTTPLFPLVAWMKSSVMRRVSKTPIQN